MKLLYIGHTYTVRANQSKIAALARLPGVELTLLTPHAWKGPLYNHTTHPARLPNVNHQIVRAYGVGREGAYLYGTEVFRLILDLQPDIVHVEQGAHALSYTQVLFGLKRLSRKTKATFFTWWNLPYKTRGVKKLAEHFNLNHSACAVAGNESAKSVLRDHGFDRPIFVMPQLGVEIADFPNTRDESIRRQNGLSRFTIGYIGRIAEEKGIFDLIHAIARMRNSERVELYLVGAGEALESARRLADELGVSITHHAPVQNHEVPNQLSMIDVLVLPSRSTKMWVEQFGHILIEAMAVGVPVVGSDSGEIPNVIGDAGLVFHEGQIEELAIKLDDLFEQPEQHMALIDAGKKRVSECYTHDTIARRQMVMYEWMLAEGLSVGQLSGTVSSSERRLERLVHPR